MAKVERPRGTSLRAVGGDAPTRRSDGSGRARRSSPASRTDAWVAADDGGAVDAKSSRWPMSCSWTTTRASSSPGSSTHARWRRAACWRWRPARRRRATIHLAGVVRTDSGCGRPILPRSRWASGTAEEVNQGAGRAKGRRRWQEVSSGAPKTVEVTALEVMAVCLNNHPSLYCQFTGNVAMMSRWRLAPDRALQGRVDRGACSRRSRADFAGMIGRDDLAADDRLNSMGGRGRNRELAQSVVRPWVEQHTAAEIHELGGLFRAWSHSSATVATCSTCRTSSNVGCSRSTTASAPRPPLQVETTPPGTPAITVSGRSTRPTPRRGPLRRRASSTSLRSGPAPRRPICSPPWAPTW